MKETRTIYITDRDLERLERLIYILKRGPNIDALEEELARASIVRPEEIPPNVVTMNSRVRFLDCSTEETLEVTLVYPQDADIAQNRISVLAPVGSALLGLSVGDTIEWPMPSGQIKKLKIVAVPFQPEAVGKFDS